MKQEDKELLLKDLCARLPYGVQLRIDGDEFPKLWRVESDAINGYSIDRFEIKPYLRPMTSMTEDERKEWKSLIFDEDFARLFYKNDNSIELWVNRNSDYDLEIDFNLVLEAMSWLLAHHFDFMGLIPKGLAIEINKDNNPYK